MIFSAKIMATIIRFLVFWHETI